MKLKELEKIIIERIGIMVKEECILDLLKAKKKLFKIANEQKDLDLMIYLKAQISCLNEVLERSIENESK